MLISPMFVTLLSVLTKCEQCRYQKNYAHITCAHATHSWRSTNKQKTHPASFFLFACMHAYPFVSRLGIAYFDTTYYLYHDSLLQLSTSLLTFLHGFVFLFPRKGVCLIHLLRSFNELVHLSIRPPPHANQQKM